MAGAPSQVLACVKGLLASGAYSDLTITCGGSTYKVHKAIVCERAGFFARAVRFGGQESQSGNVDLPDEDPDIVERLLQYLYEGEYEKVPPGSDATIPPLTPATPPMERSFESPFGGSGKKKSRVGSSKTYSGYKKRTGRTVCEHHVCDFNCNYGCNESTCEQCTIQTQSHLSATIGEADQLVTHTKMYEAADKYDVIGLKDLARERFARACKYYWNAAEFPMAANHAFSTTPEDDKGLRNIVSQTIAEHIKLVAEPAIRVLLTQFNGLVLGVLDAKIEKQGWI